MSVTDTNISGSVLPEGWIEIDSQAVDTIRVLAADAVQAALSRDFVIR